MDCSMPGLPVPHHFPEFAQVPVHRWCCPAISSSDTLFSFCSQSFPASGTFPVSFLSHHMTKMLELQSQHQSSQWIFRVDIPYDCLIWSPCSPRDSQESSPAPQFKGINSLVFCLLYSPPFTTIRDHWKDHSLDYTDLCWHRIVTLFNRP